MMLFEATPRWMPHSLASSHNINNMIQKYHDHTTGEYLSGVASYVWVSNEDFCVVGVPSQTDGVCVVAEYIAQDDYQKRVCRSAALVNEGSASDIFSRLFVGSVVGGKSGKRSTKRKSTSTSSIGKRPKVAAVAPPADDSSSSSNEEDDDGGMASNIFAGM